MNPRLAKEFRALRLPWLVGLAAGLVAGTDDDYARGWGLGVAFASVGLLAAMSWGNEFQQSTFALLLSQPLDRLRVWREKLLVGGVLAVTVGLGPVLGVKLTGGSALDPESVVISGVCLLATVCSAGLWTLVARSIIGGTVFTAAGLSLFFIGVNLAVDQLAPIGLASAQRDLLRDLMFVPAVLAYSAGMLWFGWRKFERLELRETILGESTILSAGRARGGMVGGWLRMRPSGGLRNLVRKELRLHKPLFVVAGVYALCWLAAAALNWLQPHRGHETFFVVLPCIYVPVMLALAGAMSLGEERTLGLAAWQLTLPVSARRQWLVKLAVAAALAIGLAMALPGLLAWATLPEVRESLRHGSEPGSVFVIGIAATSFFALSFWAATMLGNTMRAVVAAVSSCGALVLCIMLAAWCAEQTGGLERGLTADLTYRYGWSLAQDIAARYPPMICAVVLSLAALGQSLAQFRRAQVRNSVAAKYAAILILGALAGAFWCADLTISASHSPNPNLRKHYPNIRSALEAPAILKAQS